MIRAIAVVLLVLLGGALEGCSGDAGEVQTNRTAELAPTRPDAASAKRVRAERMMAAIRELRYTPTLVSHQP